MSMKLIIGTGLCCPIVINKGCGSGFNDFEDPYSESGSRGYKNEKKIIVTGL
jgi:hypothetical protein